MYTPMNNDEIILAKSVLMPRIIQLRRAIADRDEELLRLHREVLEVIAELPPEEAMSFLAKFDSINKK